MSSIYFNHQEKLKMIFVIISKYIREESSTTSTSGTITTWLIWLLNLNVTHVDLLVHHQHRRPSSLLTPVLRISSFIYINSLNFGSMILGPLFTPLINNRHKIASTSFLIRMFMMLMRTMIVSSLVENNTHKSILSCWLCILNRLEPKLMVDIFVEKNVIQKVVFYFNVGQLIDVYVNNGIRLMLLQKGGKRSSM
jgi:hypothetical protein